MLERWMGIGWIWHCLCVSSHSSHAASPDLKGSQQKIIYLAAETSNLFNKETPVHDKIMCIFRLESMIGRLWREREHNSTENYKWLRLGLRVGLETDHKYDFLIHMNELKLNMHIRHPKPLEIHFFIPVKN